MRQHFHFVLENGSTFKTLQGASLSSAVRQNSKWWLRLCQCGLLVSCPASLVTCGPLSLPVSLLTTLSSWWTQGHLIQEQSHFVSRCELDADVEVVGGCEHTLKEASSCSLLPREKTCIQVLETELDETSWPLPFLSNGR